MTKFIHISDLHIHSDNNHEDNKNCNVLVNYVLKRYTREKPVVLITGDIVDDGCEKQYKNAVSILKPLVDSGFIVLPVPGNHDYGPVGNFYTEKSQMLFQQYILGNLINNTQAIQSGVSMEDMFPMTTLIDDTVFIGVDSVVGAEDEFLHFASGEVGSSQRKRLKDILHEYRNKGKNVVVYFHHHPFDRRMVMEMDDAKKVMRLLADKINFLCFGHAHESEVYNDRHNIDWMLASGKSTKANNRNKFQYREIIVNSDSHEVSMISFS
ncbi:metallophosphoesterase [Photobacterium sp. SDRW27]|uniref:metallophosphoesterase family protein n=1 Tax=Photobacterium obscurum TaxID=2829490 RepID=UPI00224472A8|nr:metallophosphoesterase [Photobacterium obscurum]MCW8330942.1 metallophosphoesterase [Photobacterium obscurum]